MDTEVLLEGKQSQEECSRVECSGCRSINPKD